MSDIKTKEDIKVLVDNFYKRLLADEDLKHIFEPLDLTEHLPRVVHFWSFVLLDEDGYRTNVFDKHLHLPIKPHFWDKWLNHFTTSVDELYQGELAEMAKQRAISVTYTFKNKFPAGK